MVLDRILAADEVDSVLEALVKELARNTPGAVVLGQLAQAEERCQAATMPLPDGWLEGLFAPERGPLSMRRIRSPADSPAPLDFDEAAWSLHRFALLRRQLIGGWACAVRLPGGEPVGVLAVLVPAERSPGRNDVLALEEAGRLAAIAVEQGRSRTLLQRQAQVDKLTDLPNRLVLADRLAHAVARAREAGQAIAVAVLDLDSFKILNDSLGHAAGDQLLRAVGQRLRTSFRDTDTVSRLGGDEFALVLPLRSASATPRVVEKIAEALRRPFELEGRPVYVTASIGVSLHPDDGDDAETLLRCADAAMTAAKTQGRDNVRFFAPALQEHARERLSVESDLRRALAEDELELHYQPRVDTSTQRVVGMEALVRWRHPQRGLLLPGAFLPVAQDAGLMPAPEAWVLRRATSDCAPICREHGLRLAVNLTPERFRSPNLVDAIANALATADLAPEHLELEITEGTLMGDPEGAVQQMQRLRQLEGLALAVDDFGTGYSSLAYLQRFPLDTLKVDRSFVAELGQGSRAEAIVRTVVTLAHELGLRVVAEGVETEAQREAITRLGCHEAQGFLLGRPVPLAEVLLALLAAIA